MDAPEQKRPFKVLALDGGGAKGFYTLGSLLEVEALVRGRLCDKFDLIYGTSTGAIIAALLGLGYSVGDIKKLYESQVMAIMSRWLPSSKTAALEHLAAEVFGTRKFEEFKTDMGIVGTRWIEERPIIFKTNRLQLFNGRETFIPGFGCTISDAVVASCSAYPFFKPKIVTTGYGEKIEVCDGGFVANNPTLFSIVEATESLNHKRRDIRVLSIGVGEYPQPKSWSVRKLLSKIPSVVLLQKTMEINTQSMDQLTKVLYRDIQMVRLNGRYTQPEMATDMFESDPTKLGLIWQRGRDSAREAELDINKLLI